MDGWSPEPDRFEWPAAPGTLWMQRAACQGMDVGMFFPGQGHSATAARRVCSGCPVRSECLDYAIETDAGGVWGGLSEKERRTFRRERSRNVVAS